MLIIFFLWGPNKIPQLARAVGQAKREYDTASKELSGTLEAPVSGSDSAWTTPSTPVARGADNALVTTAQRLGITTEGKTTDEISSEILQKASDEPTPADQGGSYPRPPPAPPSSLRETKKT